MAQKIATFDDWKDLFFKWQKDIGFDSSLIKDYNFDAFYDGGTHDEIEFGEFKGRKKFSKVLDIPTQDMRDALLHLIYYQGDTEFASSEQQRKLVDTAPSDYDRQCLLRVMREEMRHGWQMCHILVSHFGDSGKLEARKLLERRAYEGTRLLGAFNKPVDNWIDFFTYTCFIDRDGKYQLTMLRRSSFAPLSRSMGPMLKEEAFHLFTGQTGLARVVKAGKVPIPILQKYLNKWLSTGYDLLGKDRSGSAARFYRWGFKGRFNEAEASAPPKDLDRLNEESRELYYRENCQIIEQLNQWVPADQPRLRPPDLKFNREIGEYAGKPYSVDGVLLSPEEHQRHLKEVLPGPEDAKILAAIFKDGSWVAAGNA
ncbi:MAG TPA: Phenylacetic acid catabolic protein [candidate division Zixibacteria bacterium]|nr:Phenylacetic acid catabolic protein [candidate division Zixibacteria bacterium]